MVYVFLQRDKTVLLEYHLGELRRHPKRLTYQSEHWVVQDSDGDYTLEEAEGIVKFMRRCLRLSPADRTSAKELLEDEWLNDAEPVTASAHTAISIVMSMPASYVPMQSVPIRSCSDDPHVANKPVA